MATASSLTTRGTETEPESSCVRRDPLDLTDWRPLARPAGALSLTEDLLAALTGWGGARRRAQGLASLFSPTRCPRPAGWGRSRRRWPLGSGEKRGAKVGKTTRGKGTKWMVVVDG